MLLRRFILRHCSSTSTTTPGTKEMDGSDIEPPKSASSDQVMPSKPKIVIIMGATGTGKSRLAIDLASHFPIEIINADSMQVYRGLDILTNKVPAHEQKGVPHHLLGTISPDFEFTSKHFRDSAISIINEIISRNRLPVIVGGTNYYIQALVSPFLFDDSNGELDEFSLTEAPGDDDFEVGNDNFDYDRLRDLDPVAANRIHPNDQRKINQYLRLYARSGVLPSKLFQQRTSENWGRVDDFRFDCCFICVDATLPVVDQYVNHRVDCMIDGGLLDEVYDIYKQNADYTRGLRQAIGVREFEDFLRVCLSLSESQNDGIEDLHGSNCCQESQSRDERDAIWGILHSSDDSQQENVLQEAIEKVKLNTRRLVRRQKRRLNRLQSLFEWKIHHLDATEYLSCHLEGNSDDSWAENVIEPSVEIIKSFLSDEGSSKHDLEVKKCVDPQNVIQRDLWTQYTCEACGGRILRGAYEFEQHKQGRGHRKRVSRLKKSRNWVSATNS